MNARRSPLRVLFVIDTLELGGPARIVATCATGLRHKGIDARVAHLGIGDWYALGQELHEAGVPLINLQIASLLNPGTYLRLSDYVRREQIDVLHTHNRYAHIVGRTAAALAHRPVVSTVHNLVEALEDKREAVRRQMDYATARHVCQRVLLVCEAQRRSYLQASRVSPTQVAVCLNGVDTDRFRPDEAARTRTRRELGVPDATPLFASIAVLRHGKGIPDLLLAARGFREQAFDARFIVIGDGGERRELQDRSRALGLESTVRFLGERTDVGDLLAATDVYVQPSLFEAMPTSILEAMAVGLPIVATAVGGIPEAITHQRTGLLVPPSAPEKLAAALTEALDPGLRISLGGAARAWVEANASVDGWLDQHLRIYAGLVGTGG